MLKQVGKYKLEKVLGRGAMGTVYLSRHPELDIPVAVKILNHAKAAMDPEFRSRFIKEGRLAGKVNHQNVIRVYDAGNEGETYFLVMEFIEGSDAKELLDQKGPMELNEVLNIAICCAQALSEAHRLGIIHRDIKPDNIMVTSKGRIKLADMGIAKQLQDDFSTTITGMAMGTPYYMSPEQAVDASTVDGRCDIYSLGATIYHLLTGYRPFDGESTVEILIQHARATVPHPQTLRPDLPESICAVIYKMMEKKPENRYASCIELVEDLSAIRYANAPLEELSIYDSQTIKGIENDWKTTRPFGDPPPQKKKNHKLLYTLIGVIVLLLIILAAAKKKRPGGNNNSAENENAGDIKGAGSPLDEMKEKNLILTCNNEIIVYSGKERKEVKRFTAKAAGQNPIFSTLIASDNQYYYLFTSHTDKILKFSKDGKALGHIPLSDKMIGVEFLCLPDKRFALFDNRLDNVLIFSYSGKLIKSVPIPTAKSMEYQDISAIAGGPFLFFTDSETAQIFKLNLNNYEVSEFLNLKGKVYTLSTIAFSKKTRTFYITDKDQGVFEYASGKLKKLNAPRFSFSNIDMKVRNKTVFFLENTVVGEAVNQKLHYLNMENGKHAVIATFKKKVNNFVLVDSR